MACPERFELPTCWLEASCSAPLSYGQSLTEKPGFEPGWDALPSRLANERLKPLGHFSIEIWGDPPDSNRHLPGSQPSALPLS